MVGNTHLEGVYIHGMWGNGKWRRKLEIRN
jgi:hypothetical protein